MVIAIIWAAVIAIGVLARRPMRRGTQTDR
jgi:hypothetical protein